MSNDNELCANLNLTGGEYPECSAGLHHNPCDKTCPGFRYKTGSVTIPASLLDKVRALLDRIEYGIVTKDEMEMAHAVREALAEIEKGE